MSWMAYTAVGVAVLFTLWVIAADHEQSMARCQETMSLDTCAYSLR